MRRILSYWWLGLIVSLTMAIAIPLTADIVDLRITKAFFDLSSLHEALKSHKERTGAYPPDLGALVGAPLSRIPVDPWGNRYIYRKPAPSSSYELYSAGADAQDNSGGGDDITDNQKIYSCETYGINCPPPPRELLAYACVALGALSLLVGLGQGVAFGMRLLKKSHAA
jgi:hypothetical protein